MKPADDYAGTWDNDMDMHKGIGKLWHEIKVNASYSHRGSYDRWMELESILRSPYWASKMESIEGEDEVISNLVELEDRGKINCNFFEMEVRIAPDVAKQEMKSRDAMRVVVENWEQHGGSFTYGT